MNIKVEELYFFESSKESVESFLGTIGFDSDGGYLILEDNYEIDITLERLLEFTSKHEVTVIFSEGNIIIST